MKRKTKSEDVQLHSIAEGTSLFCAPQGNILFGCPPEVLKRIMAAKLPMPDTVVLPERLHHGHSCLGSLEFPLYHFLFVQRGLERKRRFQVVGTPQQCEGMVDLLRVTVFGPREKEMRDAGTPAKRAKQLAQETEYWALKNPDNGGKPYKVTEMLDFHALSEGQREPVYQQQAKYPAVQLERTGPQAFRVLYGEEAFDVSMDVTEEVTPAYELHHEPFRKEAGHFDLHVLGRSNGFDPQDPANGYLLNLDGHAVLWDCPAYLHLHLKKMGIGLKDIDALVLSHVHEDHLDTSESLRDPPLPLYTTPEVYHSLLVKVAAQFNCSMEEAARYYDYHPLEVDKPLTLFGAKWRFFHAVHAIPALGCRVEVTLGGRRGLLHISGDHLADEALHTMHEKGGLAKERYEQVMNLLTGEETLTLIDAGGGLIHGDYHDYLDRKQRIGFMHTGLIQEELPPGMELVRSGQVFDVLEG